MNNMHEKVFIDYSKVENVDKWVEDIVKWIKTSKVDHYNIEKRKEVFVATKLNSQIILTCERVEYPNGLHPHPHINIFWINNGESGVMSQDILDETYGQIKHGVGIWGEWIENIWQAFLNQN